MWRRRLDGVSASEYARRGLACAYWLLAFTVLGDLLVSLKIQPDDVTPKQFRILFVIAAATIFQMALVAPVLAPVAMRFAPRTSLRKALIILGSGAFVSMLVWAIGILANMHEYGQLAK
jgi:formate hydrogenlyase subunit 4